MLSHPKILWCSGLWGGQKQVIGLGAESEKLEQCGGGGEEAAEAKATRVNLT